MAYKEYRTGFKVDKKSDGFQDEYALFNIVISDLEMDVGNAFFGFPDVIKFFRLVIGQDDQNKWQMLEKIKSVK